ncbi:ROK family glucokinase [Tuberibacillus sp. Marseille-P3662]|uniref:ROK family glucokinase n=1 Tax=Tuberibacillus sp. Marseille-P3662 TaxID=1965358 RepID=UPI000A1CB949|nr:ROK family glucokinase [Tuberibacillus sp. Marseille-P3662]
MRERCNIGVDLGGTTVKLAIVDEEGHIQKKWEIPTDTADQGKRIVKDIAHSIEQTLDTIGKSSENINGIGIGAPGFIEMATGYIYEAVNIGWKEYPLKTALEEATEMPVVVDNDANIAAIGEMWKGAGNHHDNVICMTLGTGVGGGMIIDGDIVHGIKGMAGEFGHATVVPEGGYQCNCGKAGCLETVVSATGIRRTALDELRHHPESQLQQIYTNNNDITAKDVFDAARDQDTFAIVVVERVAYYIGLVLANLATTVNPSRIVLGGGVSKAGDVLLTPVNHYFRQYSIDLIYRHTDIAIAELGNDAGIIGAAWLAQTKI